MPEPMPVVPEGMTAKSEMAEIAKLADQGESAQHKLGFHYNNIVTYRLAEAAGFKSTPEFLKAELKRITGLSQANLTRFGAIARNFTEAETLEYGVSRLEEFLVYRKIAGLSETLRPAEARLPLPEGEKPLSECSVKELRGLIRAKRTPKELPEEVSQAVDKLQAALVAVLGADHPAAVVKGRIKAKEAVVDIEGVPVEHLADVLDALKKA